jgi:hypothetical protein
MTEKTLWIVLGGLILIGLAAPHWTGATSRLAPNREKNAETKISSITWEKSYQQNGRTVTPGSAQADFGRFNFYCYLDPEGQGSLVTLPP